MGPKRARHITYDANLLRIKSVTLVLVEKGPVQGSLEIYFPR
jgi:hypothetical protein